MVVEAMFDELMEGHTGKEKLVKAFGESLKGRVLRAELFGVTNFIKPASRS
jgi:hypothetical protein